MTRFIWVRDAAKYEHYINVRHIARVTKYPGNKILKSPAYAYIVLNDGTESGKYIRLCDDTYDTIDDVIAKIQVAMA